MVNENEHFFSQIALEILCNFSQSCPINTRKQRGGFKIYSHWRPEEMQALRVA